MRPETKSNATKKKIFFFYLINEVKISTTGTNKRVQ